MEQEQRRPVIVVVEDEPEILDLIQIILALYGYMAVGFNHPYQLKALDSEVDLFLVDLMLPDMDGIRVTRMLRDTRYQSVPMIAISASTEMEQRARQSGLFNAAISKPFDVDHLLDVIAWHLPAPEHAGASWTRDEAVRSSRLASAPTV